jgi:hypothetical protein
MVLHYVSPFCASFFHKLDLSAVPNIVEDLVLQFVRTVPDEKNMVGG